jgi:hypothetical protein
VNVEWREDEGTTFGELKHGDVFTAANGGLCMKVEEWGNGHSTRRSGAVSIDGGRLHFVTGDEEIVTLHSRARLVIPKEPAHD